MAREVFCFGSNLAGIHGAGAARYAMEHYGAKWGHGIGFSGDSYALPTKDHQIETLPLERVRDHVNVFLNAAERNPDTVFLVTQIGCGLAGFTPDQIAPLFATAPRNCRFSTAWSKWLPIHETWTDA